VKYGRSLAETVNAAPSVTDVISEANHPRTVRAMTVEAEQHAVTSATGAEAPPTAPFSVVWSDGRPYVLEGLSGRPRWVGTDTRGRPQWLTCADMQRKGWSRRRSS
jgi:hypothetical protein